MTDDSLSEGIYDLLLTRAVNDRLDLNRFNVSKEAISDKDQPEILARHLHTVTSGRLQQLKPHDRLALVNDLLRQLGAESEVVDSPERLTSLLRPLRPGVQARYADSLPTNRLSDAALLTNSPGEPSIGNEVRAELESADHVDLICAFIKWHGVRVLEEQLHRLKEHGIPFRVITTTYMGATERRAIDRLVRDFGAEVRISYEIARTRLHAKAWLFRRASGFDTAYIGSSNLTKVALLDGLEWNVRLSSVVTAALLRKFKATFDSYWEDPSFEPYDPDRDGDRLDQALLEAGAGRVEGRATLSLSGMEIRPFAYQAEILEALDSERERGHHRNLVVAATGTGKTVIAALDYRRLCPPNGPRPSLLFVAHRKEILEQSLRTYREVLGDPNFGDLYLGGSEPNQLKHLFASIQTLNSRDIASIDPAAFEVVVVDEFHHAAAASYDGLLTRLQPTELLGLTATPERADGVDVTDRFFDGRIAAELRLWDALTAELLCPFHYFVINDGTDLSSVKWARGSYDQQALTDLYTGNQARCRIILNALQDKVSDPQRMRALGFCVGVQHAQFMADAFNEAGISALAVSGATPADERRQALEKLSRREVNIIFSADLYNEGIDVPDVDTVLFLRPTESSTIFLQQLGRGLRRSKDKAVLTALDFVGHQRKEFRFDLRLRALTGLTRQGLQKQVEDGFSQLPSGCDIVLDKMSQQAVLENLKGQISSRWQGIVAELKRVGDCDLDEFLEDTQLDLADLLRGDRSWTRARREAGVEVPSAGPHEASLLKRVARLAHVDDARRAQAYLDLLHPDAPDYEQLNEAEQTYARMLFFSLWPDCGGFSSYAEGLQSLKDEPAFCDEASQVILRSVNASRHQPRRLSGPLGMSPLQSHASYTREEIGAALDYFNLDRKPASMMQGVFYAPEWSTDVLMVTLEKDENQYSPSHMYRDYAISRDLFHWESQSATTVQSPTGQRYTGQRSSGGQIILLSRAHKNGPLGAMPYLLLGRCDYVSHEGEKPIAITWRLDREMPADHFQLASVQAR